MTPTQIGNYRITRKIGEGGMGVVYAAQHVTLGRQAALKLLLPEHLNDELLTTRFINEAKAAAAIHHPGIVEIFDVGRDEDGGLFIAMELLEGEDLLQRRKRGVTIPFVQAVLFTVQTCAVLEIAHRTGITHRDLKPSNLFVVADPQVPGGERIKLLDFGIAKFAIPGAGGVAATRAGALMGTPAYMSPEQCLDSSKVDHRSDIYSLGCILYEMACGQKPFRASNVFDVMTMQMRDMPTPPSAVVDGLPDLFDRVIERAMAKQREQRFQTAGEFAAALEAVTEHRRGPRGLVAALGLRRARSGTSTLPGTLDRPMADRPMADRPMADRPMVKEPVLGGPAKIAALVVTATVALGLSWFFYVARGGERTSRAPVDAGPISADARPPDFPMPPVPPKFERVDRVDIASVIPGADNETVWIIRTDPPGAEVRYRARPVGRTDKPLRVRWQKQPIRMERLTLHLGQHVTHYHDFSTGEPFAERIALKRIVTVRLTSRPTPGARVYTAAARRPDVEVYEESELSYRGNTDMALQYAEGETITVVVKQEGKKTVQRDILFDTDRTETIALARRVIFIIQTVPEGAEVWLGDRRMDRPGSGIRLAAQRGMRTFVVKHPGCKDQTIRVRGTSDDSRLVELECSQMD